MVVGRINKVDVTPTEHAFQELPRECLCKLTAMKHGGREISKITAHPIKG
jgi:hypothetical protein